MSCLIDILESENIVLVDGSLRSEGRDDLTWEMYEARNYSQLNKDLMKRKIIEIKNFVRILSRPNAYTIKEVTEEIKNFEEILNSKIKYASSFGSQLSRRTKNKIRERNRKPKKLLKALQEEVYKMRMLAYSKEIHRFTEFKEINNQHYLLFLDMVKLISQELKLKRDTAYLRGKHETDMSKESDTDERLVATLYNLSSSEKSSCLLSQDMDFARLLGVVSRMICSDTFLPYNKNFRKRLIQNPFRLYVREIKTRAYELTIQSSEIIYDNELKIGNIEPKRSEEIKQEIAQIWEKLKYA